MNNLEDFMCALSFNHKNYLEKPIILACEHASCSKCVDDLKKKTGLEKVKCLKCNKENSLKVDYV